MREVATRADEIDRREQVRGREGERARARDGEGGEDDGGRASGNLVVLSVSI